MNLGDFSFSEISMRNLLVFRARFVVLRFCEWAHFVIFQNVNQSKSGMAADSADSDPSHLTTTSVITKGAVASSDEKTKGNETAGPGVQSLSAPTASGPVTILNDSNGSGSDPSIDLNEVNLSTKRELFKEKLSDIHVQRSGVNLHFLFPSNSEEK